MKSDLAKARNKWLNSNEGKRSSSIQTLCAVRNPGDKQFLINRLVRAFIAGWNAFEEPKRCPHCHLTIAPDEVRRIWMEKFGSREKPHYKTKCKLCGKPAGEHYGTDCEKES